MSILEWLKEAPLSAVYKERLADSEKQIAAMEKENATLKAENTELKATVENLRQEIHRRDDISKERDFIHGYEPPDMGY